MSKQLDLCDHDLSEIVSILVEIIDSENFEELNYTLLELQNSNREKFLEVLMLVFQKLLISNFI